MKFHFSEDFSVRFAETDAAGVVHFSNFLRWAENAVGDFFRKNALKLCEKTLAGTTLGFPIVAIRADYRAPARYADRIRVGIRPARPAFPQTRKTEWIFEIFRVEKTGDEKTLLAEGSLTNVYAEISADGKIVAAQSVPAALSEMLEKKF